MYDRGTAGRKQRAITVVEKHNRVRTAQKEIEDESKHAEGGSKAVVNSDEMLRTGPGEGEGKHQQ